jgi:hypothetical protein
MKKVWNLFLFTFFVMCMFLFKPRQDVVFSAMSKSQYIRLYEKGMDFELSIKDNTFTGTYTILRDTVYLSYREQPIQAAASLYDARPEFRKILPRKLHINKRTSMIRAADGKSFSARIYQDTRRKHPATPAYSIRVLKNQDARISGIETVTKL